MLGNTKLVWRFWGSLEDEVGPRVLGGGPTLAAWLQPSTQPPGEMDAAGITVLRLTPWLRLHAHQVTF